MSFETSTMTYDHMPDDEEIKASLIDVTSCHGGIVITDNAHTLSAKASSLPVWPIIIIIVITCVFLVIAPNFIGIFNTATAMDIRDKWFFCAPLLIILLLLVDLSNIRKGIYFVFDKTTKFLLLPHLKQKINVKDITSIIEVSKWYESSEGWYLMHILYVLAKQPDGSFEQIPMAGEPIDLGLYQENLTHRLYKTLKVQVQRVQIGKTPKSGSVFNYGYVHNVVIKE